MIHDADIESLRDDGFEGSYDEHRIFREVFFGNDSANTIKRCFVTDVIDFECDSSHNATSSLCSNSDHNVSTSRCSQEGSEPFAFRDGSEFDTKSKRMKLPSNELPDTKHEKGCSSYVSSDLDFDSVTIPLHIVESSSTNVSISSYLLKQKIEKGREVYQGDPLEKSKLQNSGKCKAIASPVSQESFAMRRINAASLSQLKDGSKVCSDYSNSQMLDASEICLKVDPKEDPRPLLLKYIGKLLSVAGWNVEKYQRPCKKYSDTAYISPKGRRFREFPAFWRSLGESLMADHIVINTGTKKWTGINDFWSDLSLTLLDIEENMKGLDLVNTRALWWSTLEPFVSVVFIDRKVGSLRKGNDVEASWRSIMEKRKEEIVGSMLKISGNPESVLTVSEEIHGEEEVSKCGKSLTNKYRNFRESSKKGRSKGDNILTSSISRTKCNEKKKTQRGKARRRKTDNKGGCRLLPINSSKGGKQFAEGKWYVSGPRTVLSWLIASKVISRNEAIQLRDPDDNTVVKIGLVSSDGVVCTCCNRRISLSEFKSHGGFSEDRPCLNLFMDSGQPFTSCQLQAWADEYQTRRRGEGSSMEAVDDDPNDDSCGICGDGGDLICCDNCPSTYHQACLSMEVLPEGNWYCTNCTCWICGVLVETKEPEDRSYAVKCFQCEHKYHVACLRGTSRCSKEPFPETYFCGQICNKVYTALASRVGAVNRIVDGLSWTLLKCFGDEKKVCSAQWLAMKAECNSKLAVALSIMEQCFLSMVDARTGVDMLPNMLYNLGSKFARLNFNGFYTVVLEKDDVLVSVASIRLHGVTVAEMPLVATCSKYRRQGMCRILVSAIEEMLMSFEVEKLLVAALPSLVETWTQGFGFRPVEEQEREDLKTLNLVVFPGTILLKKTLYNHAKTDVITRRSDKLKTEQADQRKILVTSDPVDGFVKMGMAGSDEQMIEGVGVSRVGLGLVRSSSCDSDEMLLCVDEQLDDDDDDGSEDS